MCFNNKNENGSFCKKSIQYAQILAITNRLLAKVHLNIYKMCQCRAGGLKTKKI
jgi:hypothetical protein